MKNVIMPYKKIKTVETILLSKKKFKISVLKKIPDLTTFIIRFHNCDNKTILFIK